MLLQLDFAAETISRRWLPVAGLTVLAGCLPLLAAGCGQPRSAAAEVAAAAPPPTVAVGRPVRQALTISVEEPGEVQAIERTPIFARIPGYVAEVLVDMNDRVHKGQVLARLDVPEVEAEYLRQAARVAQAKAEIEQAHRARAAAEANLATARARIQEAEAGRTRALANLQRWLSEHQRIKKLVERGVVDSETRDETLNELKSAESARDETEAKVASATAAREESAAQLAKAGADVTVAEAHLQVAEADRRLAQSMLDYREIKAPFDGLVSQRHVHTGHLLKAGDTGEPAFVLVRTDRARIFVEVPEAEAVFVRPGSPATVRTRAAHGQDIEAQVQRISWILEPANRTLRAEIEMPAGDLVRPGMYASAVIRVEHPAAWTLPAGAVVVKDEEAFCYQVENGTVRRTPIRVGARNGTHVEVLELQTAATTSAIEPRWQPFTGSEQVVLSDPAALKDGEAVHVEQEGTVKHPLGIGAK